MLKSIPTVDYLYVLGYIMCFLEAIGGVPLYNWAFSDALIPEEDYA